MHRRAYPQVYKWNKRDLLEKTPLLSVAVADGDVVRHSLDYICTFVFCDFRLVQERSFLTDVLGNLESNVATANEMILREGDKAQGLYFIHSGLCEIRASFLKAPEDPAAEQLGAVCRAIGAGSYVILQNCTLIHCTNFLTGTLAMCPYSLMLP